MPFTRCPEVSPIPKGHRSLAPYLYLRGASRAMDFYARAFGAFEIFHMAGADGKIAHAEMQVGDSVLMLADESPEQGTRSPESLEGASTSVFFYAPDVDAVFAKALAAGAVARSEPTDMFWGDRVASFRDPFGHEWSIATHVEDVTPEEMQRRMQS